jgi:hypothetical protein
MGDPFEALVDVDATPDDAPRLASAMIGWLTAEGIIDATPIDESKGWGTVDYRRGPNYQQTIADPHDPYAATFSQLKLGRLEVTTGRTIYYPYEGAPGPAVCPMCGYSIVLTDPATGRLTGDWEPFSDALGDWQDGGSGTVVCPNNGSSIAINDWQWQGDWPVAVGHLGFTFWNWPQLHPDFVSQFNDRLGHRVVLTCGKL